MGFTFNFTQRGTEGTTAQGVRPITQQQVTYYLDLCIQKKVQPKNYRMMNYDTLSAEINALKTFYPASENQINMIKEKITGLQEIGVSIGMPSADAFNNLTGGREGSASALIESLIQLERENSEKMPPTDKQLEFLVSMYLCPDVNFEENFDVQRKIELGVDEATGITLWRRPTPDEFAEQLKKKMNRSGASKFIDDYRGVFHTWKQTRIRPEQQRYIRQLEERMANLGSPKKVEFSIDQEGNIVQVQQHNVDKSASYSPVGYQPLEEMQLMMFSVEEASKYIDQLKSELGRKDMYRYGEVSDNSMTFEAIRTAKDENEVKIKEFMSLQDLIFKLEAVAGYENQEVHDAVNYFLVEEGGSPEALATSKKTIKDFMLYLVENEYIALDAIAEMCKNCKTAQQILIG